MANLTCNPAENVTTQTADLSGTGDFIPPANRLRLAYSTTQGGPYTSIVDEDPGTNTDDQLVSGSLTGLSATSAFGATYFYVVQEVDPVDTVLDESAECEFTTLPYNPTCNILASDEGTITIEICADFVNTDQQLQAVWGDNPGGPYNNVGATIAGTFVNNQCEVFVIPVPPCEVRYWKARVTPVPAEYEVDWTYAHAARTANDESMELRLGNEADYPGGQTVVDAHNTGPNQAGVWTLRQGTFQIAAGTTQLHMGFVSTSGVAPSIGNFLDGTSIILRQTFPGNFVVGEQIINGGFEFPVQPAGSVTFPPEEPLTPGIAWQSTDPCNCLEYWTSTTIGGLDGPFPAYQGIQFAELNAFVPAELFQVVNLAVGTADSLLECPASAFLIECDPATNVECTTATINGRYCGLQEDYWVAFEFGPTALGPWTERTALTQSFGPQEAITNFSANLNTNPNQVIFYRVVVLNENQELIATSDPVCSLTAANCVVYCGMFFDPDDCVLVDPGNGDPPYWYCFGFAN